MCVCVFCDSAWLKNVMTESKFSGMSIMEILTKMHVHLFHFQRTPEFAHLSLFSSVALGCAEA
jgi:hypothetical protein